MLTSLKPPDLEGTSVLPGSLRLEDLREEIIGID